MREASVRFAHLDPFFTGRRANTITPPVITEYRNLERAGVPRSVAMKITGHRTEAVYRRYAIVSDADLKEATRELAGMFIPSGQGASRERGQ